MSETVLIHYALRRESGEIVESNLDEEPLSYVMGSGEMIPALEEILATMGEGEERTGVLAVEQGFGPRDDQALVPVPLDHLPGEARRPGVVVQARGPNSETLSGTVVEVGDDRAVVDFNHPLAGEQLRYTLRLIGRQ